MVENKPATLSSDVSHVYPVRRSVPIWIHISDDTSVGIGD